MKPTSIETTLAYEKLKVIKEGEVCAYDTLRTAIGKNPQGDGYSFIASARRRVEREQECVLEAVDNVGIKRLPPREVINRGAKDLVQIRRGVREGMRRQTTVVPVESLLLSNEDKIQFHTQLSHFGVLAQMTKPGTAKKIAAAVEQSQRILPAAETLALFKNGK